LSFAPETSLGVGPRSAESYARKPHHDLEEFFGGG
jgi:hypothetical protein